MVWVRLLGRLEVRTAAGAVVRLGAPKQRVVGALLAVRAGQVVPVAELVDEVWPDRPPASAAENARSYAANLRRLLTGAGLDPVVLSRVRLCGSGS